jgi:hypothetical protein
MRTNAIVDEVSRFYKVQNQTTGTHLALRWKGRIRIIIPRNAEAHDTCLNIFMPGRHNYPLRAMARMPRLSGAINCVEAERLTSIRKEIGNEVGLSCCRTGAPGPWSKDTILLLDNGTSEPLYIVKAGSGEQVDMLLQNEANWIHALRDQPSLVDHIPILVAHHSGTYLSFLAITPFRGKLDYRFGESHIAFLQKLQAYSCQNICLEESRLYHNMHLRLSNLRGLISESWSLRLDKALRRIERSLRGSSILFVAAHNDFTPWNIRLEHSVAKIFDWEYADHEQLPLFDPLHFALLPMSLRRRSASRMIQCLHQTLQQCQQWLGKEHCCEAQSQALAYLMSLCTLYLWAEGGKSDSNPVLECYAQIIDHLCNL